ncbi:MAG: ABC transporter ATP-binding protein [Thermoleophilia bacterium]|nr:ABC transporter ATP-binding protein [Thermoleophilia bacterium]
MADTIAVSDVTKEYGTSVKTKALRGVSFRVESKEFLSIIGQSGSGKSTLLNLLGLLDRPTEGTVSLLGTDVGALSKKERAAFRNKHLGFVFQFHHLLPEFSVRENLLIPTWIGGLKGGASTAAQTRRRAEEILDFLGVGQVADKSAEQISGGQKQRVAIGRALMNSPDILLADEPTGNLDTENSALVYDLFRRIHDEMGTTFVIVTHDRAIAQQTDRIIEVTDGLISEDVSNEYLDAPATRPSRDTPA